jgi:dihydrolipoamide dehydrogenase
VRERSDKERHVANPAPKLNPTYDLVVIGAGPGGYVAAIRAAQLGLSTLCVEAEQREGGWGGCCLNWGCIPAKALLESAALAHRVRHDAAEFGVQARELQLDIAQAVARSRAVSERLTKGIQYLFRKNGVTGVRGYGRLRSGRKVEIALADGGAATVTATKGVIVATGSRAKTFPGFEFDGDRVLSSREALEVKKVPNRIVIVGAGAVGAEFADVFEAFGAEVTLVEMMPQILPVEDEEVAKVVEGAFRKRGMKILTGTKVASLDRSGRKGMRLVVERDGKEETLETDAVLMAVGRAPNVENLGLEEAGVELANGFIRVDGYGRTTAEGIYAIGDVAGPPMLAHKASHEGIVAAEHIAGREPHPLRRDAIPNATYCHPEVASVGLTERAAREAGHDVVVGKFPFSANGRALTAGHPDGFVKIVAERTYGEILGVHVVGHHATELLHELHLGRMLEATLEEVAHTVHAHPTLSEAAMEAAFVALGRPLHI